MPADYEEFRSSLGEKIEERPEWKGMATFVPNKKLPVYNWFYYKEGFARDLVLEMIGAFGLKGGDLVLDPFCGSGTTLVACKEKGINSIGLDVLPISVFASRVKSADYSPDKITRLRENARKILSVRFVPTGGEFPPVFKKAFSSYARQDIAFLRHKILDLDKDVREFFVLGLVNTALRCSYAYKDGSVIKFRKKPTPPLRKLFRRIVQRMIKDAERFGGSGHAIADFGDARRLEVEDESVDAVITSPPYLNNIDYTRVYSIEEFFVHGDPAPGVRGFIGVKAKESTFLQELSLPAQARLYFEDMNDALGEMHRALKKGGRAAMVVGNGYVDDVVESDIILSYLAEKVGFKVRKIYILNKRFALEDRTTKKGILRESLIILEKG